MKNVFELLPLLTVVAHACEHQKEARPNTCLKAGNFMPEKGAMEAEENRNHGTMLGIKRK